jgi:hypothetical protein
VLEARLQLVSLHLSRVLPKVESSSILATAVAGPCTPHRTLLARCSETQVCIALHDCFDRLGLLGFSSSARRGIGTVAHTERRQCTVLGTEVGNRASVTHSVRFACVKVINVLGAC